MKQTEIVELVKDLADRIMPEFEAVLVGIAVTGTSRKKVVDIRVQTQTGIESQTCTAIARRLNELLGDRDLFEQPYEIQVGSPGIGYPIAVWEALRSQVGRLVQITLKDTDQTVPLAYLRELTTTTLIIETKATKKTPAQNLEVNLDSIRHVTVEIDW